MLSNCSTEPCLPRMNTDDPIPNPTKFSLGSDWFSIWRNVRNRIYSEVILGGSYRSLSSLRACRVVIISQFRLRWDHDCSRYMTQPRTVRDLMFNLDLLRIPTMMTIMRITIGLMLLLQTLFPTLHWNKLLNSYTLTVSMSSVHILTTSLMVIMVPSHFYAC